MSIESPTPRGLILAAGLGTRLRPLTDSTPKCLLPIAGQPLLDWWIDTVTRAGIRNLLINTHAHAQQVRSYIQAVNQRGGICLTEAHEPHLLGSAGTLFANDSFADHAKEVVIIYADNLSSVSLTDMLDFHRSHTDSVTVLLFHADDPSGCGIVELDEKDRIVSFVEKPVTPRSDLANAGVYIVDSPAYRQIAQMNAHDIGSDVLPQWVGKMRGWKMEGIHLDIGTHAAYERAQILGKHLLLERGYDDQGRRPAVFFDRDGTLIESVHYLSHPDQVRILPGAATAVARLRQAGYVCVVVTNQSAVGRGIITEKGLSKIHQVMCDQFAQEEAVFDGIYHCPVVPTGSDMSIVENVHRKPGPGMLQQAARELQLDLSRSWMVGDMISDALAGENAHCQGSILVSTGQGRGHEEESLAARFHHVPDILTAAQLVLGT